MASSLARFCCRSRQIEEWVRVKRAPVTFSRRDGMLQRWMPNNMESDRRRAEGE
jgi:hypothetical protein